MTESTTEPDATPAEPEVRPHRRTDPLPIADHPPGVATEGANDDPAIVDGAGSAAVSAPEAGDPDSRLDGETPQGASGAADSAPLNSAEPEDDTEAGGDVDEAPISGEALLVQEGEIAGDYLEQLLDILDYDGDIDLDVEVSRAVVAIVGADDLDPLVGVRGVTLDALQELTRLTVAQQTGVRTRLMLDIGGYRAGRRTELSTLATSTVARVLESGESVRMSPMNAFERKIVHDVVTATAGVHSASEGEDPDRRVVILPDR